MRHVLRKSERRGSLSNGREISGRNKECGSHCENSTMGTNVHWEKTYKMECCPDHVRVQQDFAFLLRFSK
jgi:hypothetical protein